MSDLPENSQASTVSLGLQQLTEKWLSQLLGSESRDLVHDLSNTLVKSAGAVLKGARLGSLADRNASSLLLAAIAAHPRCQRASDLLREDGPELDKDLRAAVPYLAVVFAACESRNLPVAQVLAEGVTAEELIEVAGSFIDAIAPRSPRSLVCMGKILTSRVSHFLKVSDWTDEEVLDWAAVELQKMGHGADAAIRRVIRRVGVRRLRTMPVSVLETVSANERLWGPLVEMLSGETSTTPELDSQLTKLMGNLARQLQAIWRSVDPSVAEDAAQDALTEAISLLRDPERGYSYQGDFLGWLVSMASNKLRSNRRRRPVDQFADAGQEPRAPRSVLPMPDAERLMAEWRERYLLVERFFQARTVPRVKAIWEWMLLNGQMAEEADEDLPELKAYVEARTGEEENPDTLNGTKRRLRVRLECLRYIRDRVCFDRAEDSDSALVAHITLRHGLQTLDIPTIRGLAALARACQRPRHLCWARLAKLVTDASEGESTNPADVLDEVKARDPGGDVISVRVSIALERALNSEDGSARLRTLRTGAVREKVGFLLAPCWCLAVFDERTGDDAVRCLMPGAGGSDKEEEWIRRMMSELSKELGP